MSNYLPNTPEEIQAMLAEIGVKSIDDLFAEIPQELRLKQPLNLPEGLSEPDVIKKVSDLANQNISLEETTCFLGGGAYDHFIPAAIKHLLLRGDFFTAYTPYQAEISQGTLQTIYEYQSLISSLTGMDQSNASMYEGATALAEAVHMALTHTGRNKVFLSQTVHPEYRRVTKYFVETLGAHVEEIPFEEGLVDLQKIEDLCDESTAAVVMQYPNFFGGIEDIDTAAAFAKAKGALTIVSTNPLSLGFLTPPGELGADIVTGEGQPLGIPLSFGGPYLGFLSAKEPLLRKMPGRISGCANDSKSRRGFVLTLQAREQHIRREKAGSNICSNQALMALNATIYLSLLGKTGIKEVARQCFQKAHYLKNEIGRISQVTSPFSVPFFNEFVVQIPNAKKVLNHLAKNGILGGILLEEWFPELKNHVMIAVTEKRSLEEMDLYAKLLGGLLS